MTKARISVPDEVAAGEVFEIKTLISHPMETGFRVDSVGKPIARDILNEFVCLYNGEEVFRAELYPGVAANPFIAFSVRASESGSFEFRWTDQNGATITETKPIIVR